MPARPEEVIGDLAIYGGLFVVAFLAATLLPAQSEAAVAGLILAGHPVLLVLAVASVGNVLGSVANWGLGRGIARFRDRRWFPVSRKALARAEVWYGRFGTWTLLLSWVPVIGDPLTLAAGVLRERFWVFALIVTLAKTGRYLVIAAAVAAT